jgi:hypothetical protein
MFINFLVSLPFREKKAEGWGTEHYRNNESALVPRCKRQQGNVPGLLDGAGEAALVRGADAGEPPGHDLAALGHKTLQQPHIAVRDGVDLVVAEFADLFTAEKLAATAGTAGRPSARPSAGTGRG